MPNEQCNAPVYWWDGEYDSNCELPTGHEGDHWDGISWFNDDNECMDRKHPRSGIFR